MNLSLGLAQVARRSPDNPAILWRGGALSYGGFEDQVAGIAGALKDRHGLRPGDRIGMAMENSAEFLPVLYGIWRAGMTAIPINAKLHPRELAWILSSAGAPLCIATPGPADALGGIAGIRAALARTITTRFFDLDDFSSQVGHQLACIGGANHVATFNDANTVQRA